MEIQSSSLRKFVGWSCIVSSLIYFVVISFFWGQLASADLGGSGILYIIPIILLPIFFYIAAGILILKNKTVFLSIFILLILITLFSAWGLSMSLLFYIMFLINFILIALLLIERILRTTIGLKIKVLLILASIIVLLVSMALVVYFLRGIEFFHDMGAITGIEWFDIKHDLSYCDHNEIKRMRNLCYTIAAQEYNNSSVCDRIDNIRDRDECYATFATSLRGAPYDCEKISDQTTKDGCYYECAVYKKIYYACDMIEAQSEKYDCYYHAGLFKDLSICEKLTGYFQYKCYSEVAGSKQDLSVCDRIPENVEEKFRCFMMVGISKQDLSICSRIFNEFFRDDCYTAIAKSREDASICDKIRTQERKDNCYKSIMGSTEG